MIQAYMQVDLNNPLAVRYKDRALESFKPVEDIFQIHVVQCVTPDTLLPELDYISSDSRSPQEMGSFHSAYRMAKRIAEGEKLWVMEHDAYLRPKHIDIFRMIMTKWKQMPTIVLGTAMEIWTCRQGVAQEWLNLVRKNGSKSRGPMSCLHAATDTYCRDNKINYNVVYWPMSRRKDPRWVNLMGIGTNASVAHTDPAHILHAPCTQIVDEKYGGTVTDRPKSMRNGKYDMTTMYRREKHPDFEWISLDND